MAETAPQALAAGRFEAAFAELQQVLERLEQGGEGLEASMQLFERGIQLAAECEAILDAAELRLTRLAEEAEERLAREAAPADDEAF